MINEKNINLFTISSYTSGHGSSSCHITYSGEWEDEPYLKELIRLAKIGLAVEGGIPSQEPRVRWAAEYSYGGLSNFTHEEKPDKKSLALDQVRWIKFVEVIE